jgi:DNA-binding NarL/FixJ family response regulator
MTEISVILSDPQFLSGLGMRQLMASTHGVKLVGEGFNMDDLEKLVIEHRPQLIIFDFVDLPQFSWEKIKNFRSTWPGTRWLLITHSTDREAIYKALACGIQSILTKGCSQDEIIGAIRSSARGEKFFCNKVLDVILEKELQVDEEGDCMPSSLTAREQEILTLVAGGKSTKEIAHELSLSHHTVNTHRKNIMKKLGATSVSEWVLYALNAGLISSKP